MHQNKLADEKSPYLLQHAHNPIDWYPWGEEAFAKAKREDKPIFLSIGYSTCHWCHVMARESFEDEEVARYLNEHFISIKVDREERPDIDSIYMKVCQMMTGQGGWPLTIVMTPDQVPFFAGTYFPKVSRQGMPGMLDLLPQLQEVYQKDQAQIKQIEKSVQEALRQTVQKKSAEGLSKKAVEEAFAELKQHYDPVFGGFGTMQKFPQPQNLLFLLHDYEIRQDPEALRMVEQTLKQMMAGGIWDQIGFGFSRYTVDRRWRTPHFEKMLYDQALLLLVFAACYQITRQPFYEESGRKIISFIQNEMTSPEGAFYSAIDADSEGEEGKYYVWDFQEIYDVLGEEAGDLFTQVHGILPRGNFEGKNIIQAPPVNWTQLAAERGLTEPELKEKLEEAREKLYQAREERVRPHTDDKILTSWNSLMVAGLAFAAKAFQEQEYLEMAKKALLFIEENLFQNKRLMARYREGETKFLAYLDDYAFLSWAYLEMYEASFDLAYLQKAIETAKEMENLFWDPEAGGFFFSGKDAEDLIASDKEIAEGALPSGNSVAGFVYAKLQKLTGETEYADRLYEMYRLFHREIADRPSTAPFFLKSVLMMEYPGQEVVLIGPKENEQRQEFLQKLQQNFLPNTAVLAAEKPQDFQGIADFAAEYPAEGETPLAYICENFVCQQPTADLTKALDEIK